MLEVNAISFAYNDSNVIRDVTFRVEKGDNVSVIGESGCGKSTLLRLLYGLHDLSNGSIYFDSREILGPAFHLVPGDDAMKLVAQDFDLMPFVTVAENIGKHLSNFDLSKKRRRLNELLHMIEMQDFAHVQARFLSGGQKQRVALARAIAVEPKLLLLDEPFNQIDGFRKNAFRRNLFYYLKTRKITCIVATHDSVDALSFADQVLVMKKGEIVAQDSPINLYNNPTSYYVASLFGEVNAIAVTELIPNADFEGDVLIYPHELVVNENATFKVIIKKNYFKGGKFLIQAQFDKKVIFFEHDSEIAENQTVGLQVDRSIIHNRIKK